MDLHRRYLQQAAWTAELRHYLLTKVGLAGLGRILEVGCGTGVILKELANPRAGARARPQAVHGLDISRDALVQSRTHQASARLCQGDARLLPYAEGSFDLTVCHFLLLWVSEPEQALREMRRVTRAHGHVLALAEPDYSARIDLPAELSSLGLLQARALAARGADTEIGSRLASLFHDAGMRIIETGTIAPWKPEAWTDQEFEGEWEILRDDLRGMLDPRELARLKKSDREARRAGVRTLHVPTYFVHAQV